MKIGVISDTHLSQPSAKINQINQTIFKDITLVLHAGDITHESVLETFAGRQLIAVAGNMDRSNIKAQLPQQRIIRQNGYRIGLIHGWGSPRHIEERILERFDNVHAIVYGHTHKPTNHIKRGVLMFNPGAFAGSFLFRRHPSVGILTIDNGISGKIISIS